MKCISVLDQRIKKDVSDVQRYAVRAIIRRKDELLLVYLKETNEFKFPGGGLEKDETYESALKREVREEVGAEILSIDQCLGYIDQIYPDKFIAGQVFHMRSIYYLCTIDDARVKPNLSQSEKALGFKPMWVKLDHAIKVNQKRLSDGSNYHWTQRELYMLKYIKDKDISLG